MLRFPTIQELQRVSKNKEVEKLNFNKAFLQAYWTNKSRHHFERHQIEAYYFGAQEREDYSKSFRFHVRLIFEKEKEITFTDNDLGIMTWDEANKNIEKLNQKLEAVGITLENANKLIEEYRISRVSITQNK